MATSVFQNCGLGLNGLSGAMKRTTLSLPLVLLLKSPAGPNGHSKTQAIFRLRLMFRRLTVLGEVPMVALMF